MISNHVSLITSHESSSSAAQRKITYGISKSIHSFSNTRITCCSSGQTVSSLICACIATLSYTTATGALWFHFGVCNLGFCFCPFSAPVECESEIGFLLSTAISNLSRGCSLSSSTPARRSTTLFLVFREFEPIDNILLKKKMNLLFHEIISRLHVCIRRKSQFSPKFRRHDYVWCAMYSSHPVTTCTTLSHCFQQHFTSGDN